MKKALTVLCILGAILLAILPHTRSASAVSEKTPKTAPSSAENYGRLPLRFERNDGQADARVRYLARGRGYSLLLTETDAVLALRKDDAAMLRMSLVDAQTALGIEGEEALATQTTYLIGNDPARWRKGVPSYGRVRYSAVYPGIDLIYYGRERELEFDFVVAPGADPKSILMMFDGAKDKRIDRDGNLVLRLDDGEIVLHRPVMYQEADGVRREVRGSFLIDGRGRVGFRVGKYDRRRELVIDPVLSYSTFLGGTNTDGAGGIAVDADGNAYVVGQTLSTNFPLPGPGQIQDESQLFGDAYIAKINPQGTALVYATYLGGTINDGATAITLDAANNVYLTGTTSSPDFPGVSGGAQTSMAGLADVFVAKLNAAGSAILYATYLGGSAYDFGQAIAVDDDGNAFITGRTESLSFAAGAAVNGKSGRPLYRSADGGDNWTDSATGLDRATVVELAIDPGNAQTVYAGTVAGLFKSIDGGLNWSVIGPSPDPFNINDIAIDPTNTATIYTASFAGIHKSTNGGGNLALLESSPFDAETIVVDPVTPTNLYAGTRNNGAYKSTDGGMTWAEINNRLSRDPFSFGPPLGVFDLAIDPTNPSVLYAATSYGVYKTTNGGTIWAQINHGIGDSISAPIMSDVVISPSAPNTLFATVFIGATVVYKTTDGGANWSPSDDGMDVVVLGETRKVLLKTLAIDPSNANLVYVGTNSDGIFRSLDGGVSWAPSSEGLRNRTVNALAVPSTDSAKVLAGVAAGTDAFIARLNAVGSAFDYLRFLGGDEIEEGRGIAVDAVGHAYLTGSTGSTNFPVQNALQSVPAGALQTFVTKVSPDGSAILYSTYFGGTGFDGARAIAVNPQGEAYVGGTTSSADFPVTNSVKPPGAGQFDSDGFVFKLNGEGSGLIYSTRIGGTRSDQVNAMALAPTGEVVVAGLTNSEDFPVVGAPSTLNPGGLNDGFVGRLNASGSALTFAAYLGGSASDDAISVAIDLRGDIYVAGNTTSPNFPTVNPLHPHRGATDTFVARIISRADLQLTISESRDPVRFDSDLVCTITITNAGPDAARETRLSNTWSAPAAFVSAVSDRGPCTRVGDTVDCEFGDLMAGETATVAITIKPAVIGAIVNTATATSLTHDETPADNTAMIETTVTTNPSIAGRVALANGQGLPGALVLRSPFGQGAITREDGFYQIVNLDFFNSYLVSVVLPGYTVRPSAQYFPNLRADATANFTAAPCICSLPVTEGLFPANFSQGQFELTAEEEDCQWEGEVIYETGTPAAWIWALSASRGAGTATIPFEVAANPASTPRQATIRIGGHEFIVRQGANFTDVPESSGFYTSIGKLSALGITSGCGNGNFCPSGVVTREQMAVFLIRALGVFNPPQPAMQRFADVPPENPFYAFIEQMAVRGITSGCGNGNYCPGASVTREQAAVFLIRALGEFDPPPPAQQRFLDVPPENPFYRFIEEMAGRQITVGCGSGNYCPSAVVTREQMAAFLVRAFGW